MHTKFQTCSTCNPVRIVRKSQEVSESEIRFEFLKAEGEFALTLIRTADVESQSPPDREHAARAIARAREALDTIRHFLPRFKFAHEQIEYLEERCRLIESLAASCLDGPGRAGSEEEPTKAQASDS